MHTITQPHDVPSLGVECTNEILVALTSSQSPMVTSSYRCLGCGFEMSTAEHLDAEWRRLLQPWQERMVRAILAEDHSAEDIERILRIINEYPS